MRTIIAGDEPPRRVQIIYGRQSGRDALGAAVAAFLRGQGVTVTEWQAYILERAYGHYSGPRGPLVATAGPAFPPGANVPNVIVAEIV